MENITEMKYGWGNAPDETAGPYIERCRAFVKDDILFSNFRRDPEYGKILSGDPKEVGDIALESIKKLGELANLLDNLDEIRRSDIVGNPYICNYELIGDINPSTVRYFNSTMEIKRLLGDFKPKKIVEVGGGYGGLCRLFSVFNNFDEYIIVDLPDVVKLAEKFLSNYPEISHKMKYISCEDLNNYQSIDDVDLFIADSSMAECDLNTQNIYIDKISKNSKFCYVVWNTLHLSNGVNEMNNFINSFDDSYNKELIEIISYIRLIYIRKRGLLKR